MDSMMSIRNRILMNTPHLETASGSIASFKTDVPAKLKECKVYFEPKQEGSGTPSPDNVRNIVGRDGVTLCKAGKNIVNIVGFSARNTTNPSATRSATNDYGTTISTTEPASSLIITQSQAPEAQNYQHYRNGYFTIIDDNLEYDQKYRVSFIVTDIVSNPLGASLINWRIYPPYGGVSNVSIDGNKVSFVFQYNRYPSIPNRHGIEARNCGMSCTISKIMVTPVTDEDITYEPPSPLEIPISFGRTIYGGYVDLVSGELVATHAKVVLDGSSDEQWDGSTDANGWRRLLTNPVMKVGDWYDDPMTMCDRFTKVAFSNVNISTEPQIRFGADTSSIYCYYLSNGIGVNTVEEFKTWLSENPVTVTYPLATPIRYDLPPQTIRTLKGVNNIFTVEDNTTLTATYWTH